jgi:peptidoglycan L-alanyl-D-glutamate endopeptidase CwlK
MSSRSLDDLRPEVRPQVDAFLAACKAASIDVLVTCTLRSNAEQAALYAQGRTTPGIRVTDAPAGRSAHNFGLAIDVVPVVNGKLDWERKDPVWQKVGQLGVIANLQWAGTPGFPFPELPHFQHPNWRALAGIT